MKIMLTNIKSRTRASEHDRFCGILESEMRTRKLRKGLQAGHTWYILCFSGT